VILVYKKLKRQSNENTTELNLENMSKTKLKLYNN